MIKVGQIYNQWNDEIFVVTLIDNGAYSVIYKDGFTVTYDDKELDFLFNKSELIAEYPTWQEAVNSKEFRND